MHNYGPRGTCIIVMKFENDPFSTVQKIAVTIFHSQNPRWPSVRHLEFRSVKKTYNAQLGTKGNLHTKFEKDPFHAFPKIAVTNFHIQNPRWLPLGHLEFRSLRKRYNAQLGTKGNLHIKF